jgi:hypothetical protein
MTKANSSLILSADITNFQGDAGLFLGREIAVSKFADLSGLPTNVYAMVVLRIEGEQCRLQRIELPAPNSADRDIVIEPGGELDLKPPTSTVHLKIVVTHGKLESVQVNNTFMQIGSNFQRKLQANTACGLYIRKGRADFENVSLLID